MALWQELALLKEEATDSYRLPDARIGRRKDDWLKCGEEGLNFFVVSSSNLFQMTARAAVPTVVWVSIRVRQMVRDNQTEPLFVRKHWRQLTEKQAGLGVAYLEDNEEELFLLP